MDTTTTELLIRIAHISALLKSLANELDLTYDNLVNQNEVK